MARTAQAKIRRFAVFVKELRNNRTTATGQKSTVFVRRHYDIVEYDWSDDRAKQTYIQPNGSSRPTTTLTDDISNPKIRGARAQAQAEEVYDDLKIFDKAPDWDKFGIVG